jgi:hypothetical protein
MQSSAAIAEVGLAIRVLAALVFLTAAYGKLQHWNAFLGVIANYRLLPEALVAPVAVMLPPVEAVIGAMLLLDVPFWPEVLAAGLLMLFALAMGINILRGRRHIDCGCFQSALKQTLSWTLVLRNIALSLLLGAALLAAPVPPDAFVILNGCLVGGVLFVILQSVTLLGAIVPTWRTARDLRVKP